MWNSTRTSRSPACWGCPTDLSWPDRGRTDLEIPFFPPALQGGRAEAWQRDSAPEQARYLVGGSVQYVPERINVHVRLLQSASGRQLWSERYERPLDDLFDVQRAITVAFSTTFSTSGDGSPASVSPPAGTSFR